MSDTTPVANLDIVTGQGHTLKFLEDGTLEVDGTPVTAGTPSEVTAAGSTVVSVTQTGTGALEITGNTTGGVTVTAGASTGKVEIGAAENLLGFYGVTAVARPSSSGVTTVAELITLLITTGLIST